MDFPEDGPAFLLGDVQRFSQGEDSGFRQSRGPGFPLSGGPGSPLREEDVELGAETDSYGSYRKIASINKNKLYLTISKSDVSLIQNVGESSGKSCHCDASPYVRTVTVKGRIVQRTHRPRKKRTETVGGGGGRGTIFFKIQKSTMLFTKSIRLCTYLGGK